MINSDELNKRGVSNAQDIKQQDKETKRETRLNQITENSPEILTNSIYTPAFLRQQIGKLMRVEFLVGTNNMTDRIGFLEDVGASYILLRSFEGDSQIYADIYAIKFITISATYTGMPPFQPMNNMNNMSNMGMQNWNTNMNSSMSNMNMQNTNPNMYRNY